MTPKPWLRLMHKDGVEETTMLMLIAKQLQQMRLGSQTVDVLIGCPPGYIAPFGNTVTIDKTRGQADTIYQLCRYGCGVEDGPVLALNSDVIHSPMPLSFLVESLYLHDMALMVHQSTDPALSYINKWPNPSAYAEKQVISPYGISGAWAFASRQKLQGVLGELLTKTPEDKEVYLSHALSSFTNTYAEIVRSDSFIDLGTPAAVEAAGFKILKEDECA